MEPTTPPEWFGDPEDTDDVDEFEPEDPADPDEPSTFADDDDLAEIRVTEANPVDISEQREPIGEDDDEYDRAD